MRAVPRPELPPDVAAFDDAQRRTIAMLRDVLGRVEEGMYEHDIVELAETRREAHGFSRWFHPPEVGIGRARLPRWTRPLPYPGLRGHGLRPGEILSLDLAPGDARAHGDAGTTIAFATDEDPVLLQQARECLRGACAFASRWKTCGEIYIFVHAWAANNRMQCNNDAAVGHRILMPEGLLARGYPRSAFAATLLYRNRLHRLNPVRMDGIFAIRPELAHGGRCAAFEEMIYVHEDVRVVLGRGEGAEVGTT